MNPRRIVALALAALSLALVAGCGAETKVPGSSDDGWVSSAEGPTSDIVGVAEIAPRVATDEVLLIDVREKDEWDAGHAQGARHIPLDALADRLGEVRKLAKDRPIAFICRSGNRSAQAAQTALNGGLLNVLDVDGGMAAWAAAGLELVPPDGKIL